jgi:hypothetical protein
MTSRIVFLLASILLVSGDALATSCASVPVCASVSPNSVLFVGLVVENSASADGLLRNIRMEVQEVFAGLKEDLHEVNLVNEGNWLLKGHVYLIDAFRNQEGTMLLRLCGASQEAESSNDFLSYLRERKKGKGETSLTVSASAEYRPLQDVEIRITGPKGEHVAMIGHEGKVKFSDLEPGKYSILAAKLHYELDPDERSDNQVEVPAHACAAARVQLKSHAKVSGSVRNAAGKAVSDLPIELLAITVPGQNDDYGPLSFSATTDAEGQFTFEGVLPGRYHLGINIIRYLRDSPLPRTYYPGYRTASEAVPIAVDAGGQVDGLELRLPDYGNKRKIVIQVVDEAGKPIEGAGVGNDASRSRSDRSELAALPANLKTGRDGLLITEGYEAARYLIRSSFRPTQDFRDILSSETLEILPGKSTVEILLVLKPIFKRP